MDLSTITISAFKARFYRDFNYQQVPDATIPFIPDPNFIQDQDITNAFADAKQLINQALLGDDDRITLGYLYLSAHCLCTNINNANAGLGATAGMPVNSRSVGSVSESYSIPDDYLKNPIMQPYIGSAYGLKYLAMVMPAMVGNIGAVWGGTNA